jgi:hypothetical protein
LASTRARGSRGFLSVRHPRSGRFSTSCLPQHLSTTVKVTMTVTVTVAVIVTETVTAPMDSCSCSILGHGDLTPLVCCNTCRQQKEDEVNGKGNGNSNGNINGSGSSGFLSARHPRSGRFSTSCLPQHLSTTVKVTVTVTAPHGFLTVLHPRSGRFSTSCLPQRLSTTEGGRG